ncbi:unnamed protein product [Toxocara canis]|uniref:Uncharacterized protein n=1 Tax=Toxocara canis TaxID=6265 RepID=A0A183V9T5_TOXCA|nr:unnamed protein product [Toxocara canis]
MVSAWKVASGNGRRYNGWMTELVLMLLRECIFLASLLNDANCGELRAIRQQFSCLNDTMAESRPYFSKCNGNLTINSKARSYSVIVWDGQCAQLLDRYLLGSNISNPDFSASFLLTKQIYDCTNAKNARIAQGSFRPQLIERKIPSRALTTMSSDSKSCRSPENIPMISESMKGGDMSALLEQNSVSPQARERDRSLSSYSQSKANTYFKEYN